MPTPMVRKRIGDIDFSGFSVAGEESVMVASELNVAFDVGRAPREVISMDTVCISHGHQDHAAGVAYYFSQRKFVGLPPGRVLIHRSLAQSVQRIMAVWAELERHHCPGEVIGVEAGEDFELRRGLWVRPFDVQHSTGSLGYSLIETRHKLKPEFTGFDGPKLVELKRQGVTIEYRVEIPLVCYCGDSPAGSYLGLDHVRNARVLFLECTFFEGEHLVRAREGRHIHVSDLRGILRKLNCQHISLIHVTRRTELRVAKELLISSVDPGDLERVSFFMDRPRRTERRLAPARSESADDKGLM